MAQTNTAAAQMSGCLTSRFGVAAPFGLGVMSWLTWWACLVHIPSCMPAHQTGPGPRRQTRTLPRHTETLLSSRPPSLIY
jgi:hypothetical protein